MKKLLLIHNSYRQQGGEDIAVINELELLNNNFEVKTIFYENKIKNIFDILNFFTLSNRSVNKNLIDEINKFQPDMAYIHNTWFKISLGVFKILKKKNIKTLIKIHNFRYHCTQSMNKKVHLDNQSFCQACGLSNLTNNLFNKYFQSSFLKSLYGIYFGKKYLKVIQDEYFSIAVLTEFHKHFLDKKYARRNKVYVIPNYLKENQNNKINENNYFIYAGRLSAEKGIYELIESYLKSDLKENILKIVGDGPEYLKLKNKYQNKNIEFLAQLPNDETIDLIMGSKGVISATKLYEGQPTLLCEASLNGKTSLFPNSGGIKEFLPVNYDFLFNQFDYQDFTNKLNKLNEDDTRNRNSQKAKEFIRAKLDPQILITKFNEIILNDE
tara:strand:- start:1306 stop:2454 length:1149 start_codon:yes stop_codon:yes gene_type:complete